MEGPGTGGVDQSGGLDQRRKEASDSAVSNGVAAWVRPGTR